MGWLGRVALMLIFLVVISFFVDLQTHNGFWLGVILSSLAAILTSWFLNRRR